MWEEEQCPPVVQGKPPSAMIFSDRASASNQSVMFGVLTNREGGELLSWGLGLYFWETDRASPPDTENEFPEISSK